MEEYIEMQDPSTTGRFGRGGGTVQFRSKVPSRQPYAESVGSSRARGDLQ